MRAAPSAANPTAGSWLSRTSWKRPSCSSASYRLSTKSPGMPKMWRTPACHNWSKRKAWSLVATVQELPNATQLAEPLVHQLRQSPKPGRNADFSSLGDAGP